MQGPKQVGGSPPLRSQLIAESHDMEGLDRNVPVGRRQPEERTSLRTPPDHVSRDQVALAEHSLDGGAEVGKGGPDAVIQALNPSRPAGWFGIGLWSTMSGCSSSSSAEAAPALTASITRQ